MRRALLLAVGLSVAFVPSCAGAADSYQLRLTAQQLNVIGAVLMNQPYKDVKTLIDDLNNQVYAQDHPAPPPPKEESKP